MNKKNISEQELKEICEKIYNYWNKKKIIKHKVMPLRLSIIVKKLLKSYKYKDIKKGIKNYSKIVNSKDCWFNYKWTLPLFLKRQNGFEVFLYAEKENYIINNFNTNQNSLKDDISNKEVSDNINIDSKDYFNK